MKATLVLLAAAALLGASFSAHAKPRSFKFPLGPVHLDVPQGWTAAENLFGVPLAILGPKKEGSRPTFYVVPLGVKDTLFPTSSIETSTKQFQSNTERSLRSDGAEPLEFYPYKKEIWKKTAEVHTLGFRYRRDGEEFIEHTHIAVCGDRVYHLKSILTVAQNQSHAKDLGRLRDTFTCIR